MERELTGYVIWQSLCLYDVPVENSKLIIE